MPLRRVLPLLLSVAAVACVPAAPLATRAPTTPARPLPARVVGYYDARIERVVITGGAAELRAGMRDGAWSWSGRRWEPMTDSGPPARGNAAIAFDPRRSLAVFAGGMARAANDSSYEVVAASWLGNARSWNRMPGTEVAPRDHHALVFEPGRGSIMLFGGIPGDRSAAWPTDTWELRADGWSRVATEGPAGRGRTALAYDAKRRQVVLFGGVGASPARGQPQPFFNDTWVWERAAWRKVAEGGPRARYAHGMVYDERAGVVLLFGGAAAHRDAPLHDMWQWDGARWTEIPLAGATPGHRYQPVMVYDRARGRTVLYGGDPAKTDTWEWDGRRWTEITS